jgi:hypothetical protein
MTAPTIARTTIVKVAVAFLAIAAVLLALTGCSSATDKYADSYLGSSGHTTLLLNSDGTAVYTSTHPGTHRSDDTATTKWTLDDGVITVKENDVLDYDITAKTDKNSTSLFFQSKDSGWNDEVYTMTATR